MKKLVIIIVLLGMFGWAIYEFAFQSNPAASSQEEESETSTTTENKDLAEQSEPDENEPVRGLEIGNLAPDFQLATLDGGETALSDYRGKKVMINFWATWCPPCRAEMPDMEQFYQDTDVEILAINLTETEPTTTQVQQFINEFGLTFPVLLDEIVEVATVYAVQPIPTSYMVDAEGIIQFKTFGPLTYDQMIQVFDNID